VAQDQRHEDEQRLSMLWSVKIAHEHMLALVRTFLWLPLKLCRALSGGD